MRRVPPRDTEHSTFLGYQRSGPGLHQPGSSGGVCSGGWRSCGLPLCWPGCRCAGTQEGVADQQCMAPGGDSSVCRRPWGLLGTPCRHATAKGYMIVNYQPAKPRAFATLLIMLSHAPVPCHAGRALAGVGAGAASLYVPRYISEVAPISIRGALATLNQVCQFSCPCALSNSTEEFCITPNWRLYFDLIREFLKTGVLFRRSSALEFWWHTWWACLTSTTSLRLSSWGPTLSPGGASCSSSA